MYCYFDPIDGTCGLSVAHAFSTWSNYHDGWASKEPVSDGPDDGTGYFVAGFIDNKICRDTYKEMCEVHTLIYQSPTRRNQNSGNVFFFCVFDKG